LWENRFNLTPAEKSKNESAAHSSRTLLRGGYQIPAKKSRGKAKSFPPAKIVFALPRPNCISSRHTARILRGQNPKKKNVLSILEKITPAKNKRARNIFSFWGCRVKRGGGGAFVERSWRLRITRRVERATSFVLEIGASFVQ